MPTVSRLIEYGFETQSANIGSGPGTGLDGGLLSSAFSTAAARSGTYGFIALSGGNIAFGPAITSPVTARDYYFRTYMRIHVMPDWTASKHVMAISNALNGEILYASLNTDGTMFLDTGGGSPIGSTSGPLALDTWYRIELRVRINTSTNDDQGELQINGVSIASSTTLDLGTSAPSFVWVGMGNSSQTNATAGELHFDDIAYNDNQGSAQNSWPGDGSIVLMLPVSDNNRGVWTAGGGGTANLFDAINNIPAAGLAAASETNSSQIKDTASGSSNADFNLNSYLTTGLGPNATVNAVQLIAAVGSEQTSADTGSMLIVSNPTQSVADTFNFNQASAVGTYATGWATVRGAPQTAAPTLGTAPVVRVSKTQSQARTADVCFLGLYVDYSEGPMPDQTYHSVYPQTLPR